MKNKMAGLIIGGLITVSAFSLAFSTNSIGSAAAKTEQSSGMMQNGHLNPDMMNSPEMEKDCQNMMASPEMQQAMKEMMKQPQMQNMMKQMMAGDPAFKQMMSDIVNKSENTTTKEQTPVDHNAHHTNQ